MMRRPFVAIAAAFVAACGAAGPPPAADLVPSACPEASRLRERASRTLVEGRLERTLRILERADALCRDEGSDAARLTVLIGLGRDEDASRLAATMKTSISRAGAPPAGSEARLRAAEEAKTRGESARSRALFDAARVALEKETGAPGRLEWHHRVKSGLWQSSIDWSADGAFAFVWAEGIPDDDQEVFLYDVRGREPRFVRALVSKAAAKHRVELAFGKAVFGGSIHGTDLVDIQAGTRVALPAAEQLIASPDGTRLLLAGLEQPFEVYDVATARVVGKLPRGRARHLLGGELVLVSQYDRLEVFDGRTLERRYEARGRATPSPSEKRLALIDGRTLRVIDTRTGASLREADIGVADSLTQVAFSPDEQRVAAAVDRYEATLADIATGRTHKLSAEPQAAPAKAKPTTKKAEKPQPRARVSPGGLAFTDDGRLLCTGREHDASCLFDVARAAPLRVPKGLFIIDFASGQRAYHVALRARGEGISDTNRELLRSASAAFSRDGAQLALVEGRAHEGGRVDDLHVMLVDRATEKILGDIPVPGDHLRDALMKLRFSPDGRTLVMTFLTHERAVRTAILRVAEGRVARTIDDDGHLELQFSPDGRWIFSDERLLDAETGAPRELPFMASLPLPKLDSGKPPSRSALPPRVEILARTGVDTTLPALSFPGPFAITPDARYLAAVERCVESAPMAFLPPRCVERSISVWEVPSGHSVARVSVAAPEIVELALSDDARVLGALWSADTYQRGLAFHRLKPSTGTSERMADLDRIFEFTTSPDGALLAASNGDVIETATGKDLWSTHHFGEHITFAPARDLACWGSEIVNARTGDSVVGIEGGLIPTAAAFSPDARLLYALDFGRRNDLVAIDTDTGHVLARRRLSSAVFVEPFLGVEAVSDRVTVIARGVFLTFDARTLAPRASFLPVGSEGIGFAADGAVEAFGDTPAARIAELGCRFGDRLVSPEVCADRDVARGAYARALAGVPPPAVE